MSIGKGRGDGRCHCRSRIVGIGAWRPWRWCLVRALVPISKLWSRAIQPWCDSSSVTARPNVWAGGGDVDRTVARIWSAKEAVLKAMGIGLRHDTRDIVVGDESGRARRLSGSMASAGHQSDTCIGRANSAALTHAALPRPRCACGDSGAADVGSSSSATDEVPTACRPSLPVARSAAHEAGRPRAKPGSCGLWNSNCGRLSRPRCRMYALPTCIQYDAAKPGDGSFVPGLLDASQPEGPFDHAMVLHVQTNQM